MSSSLRNSRAHPFLPSIRLATVSLPFPTACPSLEFVLPSLFRAPLSTLEPSELSKLSKRWGVRADDDDFSSDHLPSLFLPTQQKDLVYDTTEQIDLDTVALADSGMLVKLLSISLDPYMVRLSLLRFRIISS